MEDSHMSGNRVALHAKLIIVVVELERGELWAEEEEMKRKDKRITRMLMEEDIELRERKIQITNHV